MVADHWGNIRMQSTEKPLNFDGQLADIAVVFEWFFAATGCPGRPGAGKSILVLRFTLDFLERRQAENLCLPSFCWPPGTRDRRACTNGCPSWLAADYPALGASAPSGHMWAWELVRAGLVLPVLDGLDEIPESLRGEAIRHLNAALDRTSPVVLTCRAGGIP